MKRFMGVMTLILTVGGYAIAQEVTYVDHIKPIIDAKCIRCHGPDSPEYEAFKAEKEKWLAQFKGPRMDTYSHLIFYVGWPDTGSLMRRLDDGKNRKDGKPGNMYVYLGSTEEERQKNLELFKKWVGYWTLKRWHEITKEELDQIRVPYMKKKK